MKYNVFEDSQASESCAKADTNTSNTSNFQNWLKPRPQQGWECPRCGRINAPWVQQCSCSPNNWSITWTSDHIDTDPDWWKHVTCHDDSVQLNGTTYGSCAPMAGGSDYYDTVTKSWVNVPNTLTNMKHDLEDLAEKLQRLNNKEN